MQSMVSDPEERGTAPAVPWFANRLYETEKTVLRVVSLDPGYEFQGAWESSLQLTIDIEGCVTRCPCNLGT